MFTNFISLAVLSSLRNMRGMSHIYRHVGEYSGARWLCKSLTCVPFHNSWPWGWRHSLGPTSLVVNPFLFEATVPLDLHLPYSCTGKVMTCSAMPILQPRLEGPSGPASWPEQTWTSVHHIGVNWPLVFVCPAATCHAVAMLHVTLGLVRQTSWLSQIFHRLPSPQLLN